MVSVTLPKQTPILMASPLAQKCADGVKTVTRRLLKRQPSRHGWESLPGYILRANLMETSDGPAMRFQHSIPQNDTGEEPEWVKSPYGGPGDLLWVRENVKLIGWSLEDHEATIMYGDGTSQAGLYMGDDDADWIVRQIQKLEKRKGVRMVPGKNGSDDGDDGAHFEWDSPDVLPWIPSIHMPKWACRTWLRILSVRAEQLDQITDADALREGVQSFTKDGTLKKYWICDPWDGFFRTTWQALPKSPREAFLIFMAHAFEADPKSWWWVIHYEKTEAPR